MTSVDVKLQGEPKKYACLFVANFLQRMCAKIIIELAGSRQS